MSIRLAISETDKRNNTNVQVQFPGHSVVTDAAICWRVVELRQKTIPDL